MKKSFPLILLGILLASASPAQAAFDITTPVIRDANNNTFDTTKLNYWFNRAKCQCATPLKIYIKLTDYTTQSSNMQLAVVSGRSDCLNSTDQSLRSDTCRILYNKRILDRTNGEIYISTTAQELMTLPGETCASSHDHDPFNINIYLSDANGTKFTLSKNLGYQVWTTLPPSPTSPSVSAMEGGAQVNFTGVALTSTSSSSDGGTSGTIQSQYIKGYQLLCAKVSDGAPAFSSPKEAIYETAAKICSSSTSTNSTSTVDAGSTVDAASQKSDAGITANDLGVSDAGSTSQADQSTSTTTSSTGVTSLDTAYVCAEYSTSSPITVTNLENNVEYVLYLVTVDRANNPSAAVLAGTITPQLEEDAWERYKRSGGLAEGDYCFIATAVHGSLNHPHVRLLREFRDQALKRTTTGRLLVDFYYAHSRSAAAWLSHHETTKTMVRLALYPTVLSAAFYLYTTLAQKLLLLAAAALALLLARSVEKRQPHRAKGGPV